VVAGGPTRASHERACGHKKRLYSSESGRNRKSDKHKKNKWVSRSMRAGAAEKTSIDHAYVTATGTEGLLLLDGDGPRAPAITLSSAPRLFRSLLCLHCRVPTNRVERNKSSDSGERKLSRWSHQDRLAGVDFFGERLVCDCYLKRSVLIWTLPAWILTQRYYRRPWRENHASIKD
jgi:hypothetical protein